MDIYYMIVFVQGCYSQFEGADLWVCPLWQLPCAPWMVIDFHTQPLIALEALFQRFFVTNTNFQLHTTYF